MALIIKEFGRVRLIEFNRPEQLNAFNYQQFSETREALSVAQVDPNIAVVVLTGAGNAFSAGADLEDMRRRTKSAEEPSDFSEFLINFELMGVQRHLKILGIFVRLAQRDGKSQYLNDIPLVENYILDLVKSYPQLNLLEDLIIRRREQN